MKPRHHWEGLLRVIHRVSSVRDLDEFGPIVLQELDVLIPSDMASFNEVDPLAQRARVIGRPRSVGPEEIEIWQRWAHQNPCLMHMLKTGDGSARRISDFLTSDQLHQLELYQHVYEPLGVEYQLSVALPAPRPVVLGIAMNRGDADFDDDEVDLLDTMRPHLVQAYRNAQLMTEHRLALDQVAGALQEDGKAFHVIGEPLSSAAQLLLARHYGPCSDLPDPVLAWAQQERASFGTLEPDRLREPLVSVRDGHRLTVRFVPGGNGPDLLWFLDRLSEPDATPLQRLGLSSREAEVLWSLTKGRSTKEIARDLGISPGTVKKHLERVYRKLGVSTATAAVAQAFDALASP